MFEGLLPAEVIVVRATDSTWEAPLHPRERACVARAVPGRLREFAAGRGAARQALRQFGVPDAILPCGPHREVVWPPGFVGSITHCGPECHAAVTRDTVLTGVGIDVERRAPVDAGMIGLICTDAEQELMEELDEDRRRLFPKRVFSAKESVYKCCFGTVGRFIDFREVEIDWDARMQRFGVRWLAADIGSKLGGMRLQGYCRLAGDYVVTAAMLGAD